MAKILGFGKYLPPKIRLNSDWAPTVVESFKVSAQRELVDVLDENAKIDEYSLAGFMSEANDPFLGGTERRVADNTYGSALGEVQAATNAYVNANINAQDIDAVFTLSAAPDLLHFNTAPLVAYSIGAANAMACSLESGCASAISHLKIAAAMVDSGQAKYVLVAQSNFICRAIPMEHPASPCLGDAATAMVIGPDSEKGHQILHTYVRSQGEYSNAVVWKRRNGDQAWYLPGEGYSLGSYASDQAKELIHKTVPIAAQTVIEMLAEKGKVVEDLDFFTSVQPRKWIPGAIARYMGFSPLRTINTYDKYAHIWSCGPVINLMEAQSQRMITNGDLIGIYAQGAGFTRAAALIKW